MYSLSVLGLQFKEVLVIMTLTPKQKCFMTDFLGRATEPNYDLFTKTGKQRQKQTGEQQSCELSVRE